MAVSNNYLIIILAKLDMITACYRIIVNLESFFIWNKFFL